MSAKKSKKRKWIRRIAIGLLAAAVTPVVLFVVLSLIFPFPQEKLDNLWRERQSILVQDREGHLLRPFLSPGESWLFKVELDEINPRVIEATIAVEDERFFAHPGVDPISIVRAFRSNLRHGRIVSGASTLTMQLARLIEPHPRTYRGKAFEAFRALQLERLRSKNEILEMYLNLAPYGGNLVGIEAASRAYFRKHAKDLTLGEAALLSGLVQSPTRLRPDRHPERAKRRRDHVLERMRLCGYITSDELAVALKEPVQVTRTSFAFESPHFARMLFRKNPNQAIQRTTLDDSIQHLARTALREQVDMLRAQGVTNGAVVVIENATVAVRALIGSCDFSSVEDCGQINGATASRSPGSALKPFTYALAFEQGIITPATVLADVPRNFSGYGPENYDRAYRGPVTVREALAYSLNLPAVDLLRKVRPERLHALLMECGITTLNQPTSHYGLTLTLGSGEVQLLELTNAYAALARLGIWQPYRLLENKPLAPGRRVLSEGAAYLVADVLSDMTRLNGVPLWKSESNQVRMAWKTGTSYGHRDAWTIAYTPEYTVGVWLGNFSAKPSTALVGIEAAAPVAARIMDQLHGPNSPSWYARPDSISTQKVCVLSGMPAGEHCPKMQEALCLKNRPAARTCTVHVVAKIDDETGQCLCPRCSKGRTYTSRVVEKWPPALAAWFACHGAQHRLMPPHFSGCGAVCHDGVRPRILSPAADQTYILNGTDLQTQKLLFHATGNSDTLYWFVNDTLYNTSSSSGKLFWPLKKGAHKITCADTAGRNDSVIINVE